jgi:hypothetical protein
MRPFHVCAVLCAAASSAFAQDAISYRVVATNNVHHAEGDAGGG